jgi:cytochrome c biogenesis protein CcmG, thiol:disulfide interchange protein DsbE
MTNHDHEAEPTSSSPLPTARQQSWRGPRLIALAIGVLTLLLVGVLATRKTATERDGVSPLIGRVAPEITGDDVLTGRRVQLSSNITGQRWTLVNFFGTWCPPCIIEHPELVAFQEANNSDLTIMSVINEDSVKNVREFFSENGGSWPVLDVPAASVDFGVVKLPENYLITPDGRVAVWFKGAVSQERLQTEFDRAKAAFNSPVGATSTETSGG